ncbi:hypothetical protein C0992_006275 [Termitomyces sp. T32_za158]|nr:hypothetical protein C0992_006275 [Termitomyces sp. T32_za158]
MVLDPRYKLAYFCKLGWQKEWITAAHKLVKGHFQRYMEDASWDSDAEDTNDFIVDNPQFYAPMPEYEDNMFIDLLTSATATSDTADAIKDELTTYLSTGIKTLKSSDPAGKIPPKP